MLRYLIYDFNSVYGEGSFDRSPLRWRRIMVEAVDSSSNYDECLKKIKTEISEFKL